MSPAITVENLGKRYRLKHEASAPYTTLREALVRKAAAPWKWLRSASASRHSPAEPSRSTEDFWALKDVAFSVPEGEVLGIIGRNGAGKSTLLKILSRITEPTTGRITIRGRVASLLEVGTGFHPELTGRENVYLNGAILGMSRGEIRRKFDEIVAFAEVDKFLDTPVKRYSSGMHVRLAFAVAAHLEPEILIVDEVLAVGDAAFQKKCLGQMSAVASQGRTVLFVSHNLGVVSTLTRRCLYMENGGIAADGPSREIVERYLAQALEPSDGTVSQLDAHRREPMGDSPVKITAISINGQEPGRGALPTVEMGETLEFSLRIEATKPLHGALVAISLKTFQGERIAIFFSPDQNFLLSLAPGVHSVTARLPALPLAPGQYCVDAGINQSIETKSHDLIVNFPLFRVVANSQIVHWLDRPWGLLHSSSIDWDVRAN